MYYIYGISGPFLLIESTDSMILCYEICKNFNAISYIRLDHTLYLINYGIVMLSRFMTMPREVHI